MKEPFLPYLTLDQIYVSPIVRQEDGTYKCRTCQEMQQVTMPNTGSKLMDAVARTLAIVPCRKSWMVAQHLDVDARHLSGAVRLYFAMSLEELVNAYKMRMICEMIQYTQLTAEEVAIRVGMTETATLDHLIRKKLKTTFFLYRCRFQKSVKKTEIIYK